MKRLPLYVYFLLLSVPAFAEPKSIVGMIDYQNPENSDSIIWDLHALDGEVIWLDLALFQNTKEPDGFGFHLDIEDLPEGETVACGVNVNYGLIENFDKTFEINLSSPSDYHAPTTIYVGDRLRFPKHTILCDAENVGENPHTKLIVRGHFVVATTTIPTAQVTHLYPIHIQ